MNLFEVRVLCLKCCADMSSSIDWRRFKMFYVRHDTGLFPKVLFEYGVNLPTFGKVSCILLGYFGVSGDPSRQPAFRLRDRYKGIVCDTGSIVHFALKYGKWATVGWAFIEVPSSSMISLDSNLRANTREWSRGEALIESSNSLSVWSDSAFYCRQVCTWRGFLRQTAQGLLLPSNKCD